MRKKIKYILTALYLTSLAFLPQSLLADYYDTVLITKHNFGLEGRDACIICHTLNPDISADTTTLDTTLSAMNQPLWDDTQSDTNSFSIEAPLEEFGTSLNCLSCHEDITGTHSSEEEGSASSTSGYSHPIGIHYPRLPNGTLITSSLLKKYERYWSVPDKTTDGMILPSGPTSDYLQIPPDADPNDPLVVTRLVRTTYGKVECDSCHDPHTNLFPPFLRANPKKLCLVCHNR